MNWINKAHGCLLGGLIGDAMGTPTDGMEPAAIEKSMGGLMISAGMKPMTRF